MSNIYYKIWVDAIVSQKTKYGKIRDWRVYTLLPISVLQEINLFTLAFWVKVFTHKSLRAPGQIARRAALIGNFYKFIPPVG